MNAPSSRHVKLTSAAIQEPVSVLCRVSQVSSSDPVFVSELHNWIVSFFSLTLFTNFTCTSLIAGRIWWMNRRVVATAEISGRKLGPAIIIIVESSAIYSACLIILLSLYLSGSYAQYIHLDGVVQIGGVVFSMLIVHVGHGLSSEAATRTKVTAAATRSTRSFKAAPGHGIGAVSTLGNVELGTLGVVNIVTTTETQREGLYSYKPKGDSSHGTSTVIWQDKFNI
ncbi:hypothetical protein C8R43DRAFT_1143408 [Mycena crocata]|nr:hypothetical protein C8R43DRAFT_1143408 [Mycena crocata]